VPITDFVLSGEEVSSFIDIIVPGTIVDHISEYQRNVSPERMGREQFPQTRQSPEEAGLGSVVAIEMNVLRIPPKEELTD